MGWLKKVAKKVKKACKKITFKAVAKVALPVVAAVVTGGTSAAVMGMISAAKSQIAKQALPFLNKAVETAKNEALGADSEVSTTPQNISSEPVIASAPRSFSPVVGIAIAAGAMLLLSRKG